MKEEYAREYPADEPKRNSKLPVMTQEKIIAELSELVYTLTDRLAPVLTPYDDETKLAEDKPRAVQSPLADQLDANNARIMKVNNKLNSLLERLEC